MANLGYWQLKAAPGVWTLELAPGRSTEIYTLGGKNEGTDEGPTSKRIIISDFRGLPVRLEVVKKKGMENEKILDVERDEDKKSKVLNALPHSPHMRGCLATLDEASNFDKTRFFTFFCKR